MQKILSIIAAIGAVLAAGLQIVAWTQAGIADLTGGNIMGALQMGMYDICGVGALAHAHFNLNLFGVSASTDSLPKS